MLFSRTDPSQAAAETGSPSGRLYASSWLSISHESHESQLREVREREKSDHGHEKSASNDHSPISRSKVGVLAGRDEKRGQREIKQLGFVPDIGVNLLPDVVVSADRLSRSSSYAQLSLSFFFSLPLSLSPLLSTSAPT